MPTVFDPSQNQDDEQNKLQQKNTVAAGGPISTGAQGQPVTPSSQKPSNSGQFTNIQNYLKANQGNNIGQQVQGKFGELKDQGSKQVQETNNRFESDAQKTGDAIAATKQNVEGAISNLTGTDDQFNQATENLNSGLNYQYSGPQSLGNEATLNAQARNLSDMGKLAGNGAGRFTLLQKFFGKPSYSTGQTRLDNLLLGTQGNQLNQARRNANGLQTEVRQAQENAAHKISDLQTQASGVKDFTQGMIETGAGNLRSTLDDKLKQFTTEEQAIAADPTKTYTGTPKLTANFGLSGTGTAMGPDGNVTYKVNAPTTSTQLISPQLAAQMGLLNYKGNVDLNALNDAEKRQQFLGQVDPTLGNRFNSLQAMLGKTDSVLDTANQLEHGAYSMGDRSAANTKYQHALDASMDSVTPGTATKLGLPAWEGATNRQILNFLMSGQAAPRGVTTMDQLQNLQQSVIDQARAQALKNLQQTYLSKNSGLLATSQNKPI